MKIWAEMSRFRDRVSLYMGERTDKGFNAATSVSFATQPEGCMMPSFVELKPEDAQGLMDELWNCGFRPTEGSGSAGALAATQRHLDDMRTIAIGSLKKSGAIDG